MELEFGVRDVEEVRYAAASDVIMSEKQTVEEAGAASKSAFEMEKLDTGEYSTLIEHVDRAEESQRARGKVSLHRQFRPQFARCEINFA